MRRFALFAVLLFALATLASAGTITFNANGADNYYPFDRIYGPYVYQQGYAGAAFGSDPVSITGFQFQPSVEYDPAQTGTWDMEVTISHFSVALNNMSTNVNDNMGVNQVVFNGWQSVDNPMFHKPYQPTVLEFVEKGSNVQI